MPIPNASAVTERRLQLMRKPSAMLAHCGMQYPYDMYERLRNRRPPEQRCQSCLNGIDINGCECRTCHGRGLV